MPKKILLYSPDNVPNIALMKLSAWHKQQGDMVYPLNAILWKDEADIIKVSCLFPKNMKKLPYLPEEKTVCGGVGADFVEDKDTGLLRQINHTWLSEEINHIMPDYSLYSLPYSMGFTSRGCCRACEFCVVSRHEGKIQATNDIYEFYDRRFNSIRLLDNNILSLRDHSCKILEQVIKENLYFEADGLDCRVLTEEQAKLLAKVKTVNEKLKFALDLHESIPAVAKGIELLIKYNAFHKTLWYVLLDSSETIEQEMDRIKLLLKMNASMYPMFYNNNWAKMDIILRHYPFFEVLKMRTDSRILRKFNRYLAYKLGFYDKYRIDIDYQKAIAYRDGVYKELGWTEGKFPGMNELKKQLNIIGVSNP